MTGKPESFAGNCRDMANACTGTSLDPRGVEDVVLATRRTGGLIPCPLPVAMPPVEPLVIESSSGSAPPDPGLRASKSRPCGRSDCRPSGERTPLDGRLNACRLPSGRCLQPSSKRLIPHRAVRGDRESP